MGSTAVTERCNKSVSTDVLGPVILTNDEADFLDVLDVVKVEGKRLSVAILTIE